MDLNNNSCVKCPLSELRTCVLNGTGDKQSKIVFIMDSPSREDDMHKLAFSGLSARKLESVLARLGLHSSQVYMTYATRCRANLRTIEGVRPANFDEIQACSQYLYDELTEIKPHVLVPMGTEAMMAVFNIKKPKVGELRGIEAWSERFNCKIIPTYGTGAILRNPNLEEVMLQDIRRAVESSKYPEMSDIKKGNYLVINSMQTFDAFCDRIVEQEEVSIDLETTGFDWQSDKIICCSFSWAANTGVLLPITKWIGVEHEKIVVKQKKTTKKGVTTYKPVEEIEKWIEDTYHPWWADKQEYVMTRFRKIMESNIKFVAQNGKFDWKFLLQMGWDVKPLAYDTLLMHYLLRETSKGEHNLEDMALQYLGKGQHKKELDDWFKANKMGDDDNKKNYARVPTDLLFSYGAADADVTLQLKNIFMPRLEAEGMADLFKHLIMPLNFTLTQMEFEGFLIDKTALHYAKSVLTQQMIDTQTHIGKLLIDEGVFKPVDFTNQAEVDVLIANTLEILDSPKQLSKLLFETLKLTPIKQTKTGYSTDEEVLNILGKKYQIKDPVTGEWINDPKSVPSSIVQFRGQAKLLRTYVVGIETRLDKYGRLHTKFLQEGTESGRLSSRDPNFQNFPRDSKLIKNMFIPSPGNVIIEADEGQNEFRWWGIYSNDPQLVTDLNDGLDIHKLVAALAGKVDYKNVTPKQRQVAKSIVFGLMFNMGTEKLSKDHGVTVQYAEEIKNIFFSRYPVAKQWKYDIVKFAKKNLYVQNRFGRVRHLLAINHPDNKIAYQDEQGAVNCVDDQTQILTKDGWKSHTEVNSGTIVATKNPNTGELEWQPILTVNRSNYNGLMYEFNTASISAVTTPNHRWLIDRIYSTGRKQKKIKLNIFRESQIVSPSGADRIHLTVDSYNGNNTSSFTNDEIELIGWLITEGSYSNSYVDKKSKLLKTPTSLTICKSLRGNPDKCAQIDNLFARLNCGTGIYAAPRTQEKYWSTKNKPLILKIRKWLPTRCLTPQFLLHLSIEQLHILYETMLLGDGCWDNVAKCRRQFAVKNQTATDMFSMLCVLIGQSHHVFKRDLSMYHPSSPKLQNVPKMSSINIGELKKRTRTQCLSERTIHKNWQGIVWCPTVENQTWIARRNGTVYVTGNSPIQGAASDYVSNAANRIRAKLLEKGLKGKLRNLIHDAIYVETPQSEIKETLEIMEEAMTRRILGIQIPLIADFKIGKRWGRMHNIKVANIIKKQVTL